MTNLSPQGDYALAQGSGPLIFSAGFTPRAAGRLVHSGVLGADADEATAHQAARLATTRAIAAMREELPAGGAMRILHLRVFVRCLPEVTELSRVADGASEAIREHIDQAAPPARTAVGVASLPGGALVEVDMVAERTS
jgi:enamine deaminase RidA (YjgF/YER057c/UK114 family)